MSKDEIKPVKINSLEIENVKRVQLVSFAISPDGLTLIGGNNGEGKTSILDSIAFALGGNSKKPSNIKREGSVAPPKIKITLSNGLIVERKGKNSTLTVTDPSGQSAGQSLLNSFISELALDLPKFMEASDKKKAETLLDILGVGDEVAELEHKEKESSDERVFVGRELKSKKGHVEQLPFYADLPEVPLSSQDLLNQNQEVLARNAENQILRDRVKSIELEGHAIASTLAIKEQRRVELLAMVETLDDETQALKKEKDQKLLDYKTAQKSAKNLLDESTEAISEKLADIDDINNKIRGNLERRAAKEESAAKQKQYDDLTEKIESLRKEKTALMEGAELPLPNLTIDAGKLVYKGQRWDCMSGSEQLIVSAAIVRKLKPQCGFVLTDKLEQMDSHTIKVFNDWLVAEGLQNIGTTVGDREECQIIIEDGKVLQDRRIQKKENKEDKKTWSFN
tara:strand:+ start:32 stop:1390 length:1359 start_codon:yes stop_codon:yes gene_type:complete